MSTYSFDQKSIQRIAKAVRDYERNSGGSTPTSNARVGPTPAFFAKLTKKNTDGTSTYQWIKEDCLQGKFQDSSNPVVQDNINFSAHDLNKNPSLTNAIVELNFYGYDANSKPVYMIGSPPPLILPVTVSKDGGSAGAGAFISPGDGTTVITPASSCTYTYTVKTIAGEDMADGGAATCTKKTPIMNAAIARLPGVVYSPAGGDPSLAYVSQGSVTLLWVTETPSAGDCSTTTTGS